MTTTPQPAGLTAPAGEPPAGRPSRVPPGDILAALSFANLAFLGGWRELQPFFSADAAYFGAGESPSTVFAAVMAGIGVVAAAAAVAACLSWQRVRTARTRRLLAAGFLLAGLWPVNEIRNFLLFLLRDASLPAWSIVVHYAPEALLGVAIYGLLSYSDWRLARLLRSALILMSPLLPIAAASVLWEVWRQPAVQADPVAKPAEGVRAEKRLVLAVFDEWDWDLTTSWRARGLRLKEIEELEARSLIFSDARSPGRETSLSLPAILTGRRATAYRAAGSDRLLLRWEAATEAPDRPGNGRAEGQAGKSPAGKRRSGTTAPDSGWESWKDVPNVFTELRKRGVASGVAGWYHPYCRLFGGTLAACSSEPYGGALQKASLNLLYARANGWGASAAMQTYERLAAIPWFMPVFQTEARKQRHSLAYRSVARADTRRAFQRLHRQALELVRRPDLGFVLLHYPLPHPPGIYDDRRESFSDTDEAGYRGNLALTSRVIGELADALQRSGLHANTALAVTSDHGLRGSAWRSGYYWSEEEKRDLSSWEGIRVPLLLSLPGFSSRVREDGRFQTIRLHEFITRYFASGFADAGSVLRWARQSQERGSGPAGHQAGTNGVGGH